MRTSSQARATARQATSSLRGKPLGRPSGSKNKPLVSVQSDSDAVGDKIGERVRSRHTQQHSRPGVTTRSAQSSMNKQLQYLNTIH